MARSSENTGTVVQAWVRPEFARQVKELANRDGRTVSNLIKVALRDRLETSPMGEDRRQAGVPRSPAPGVGSREE
jgi:hypothetical protein